MASQGRRAGTVHATHMTSVALLSLRGRFQSPLLLYLHDSSQSHMEDTAKFSCQFGVHPGPLGSHLQQFRFVVAFKPHQSFSSLEVKA